MSVLSGSLLAWAVGVLLVGALFAYRVWRPTNRVKAEAQQLKQFPLLALLYFMAIALVWPISVPILYYQACREERGGK